MLPKIETLKFLLKPQRATEILRALTQTQDSFVWFGGSGSTWTIIPIDFQQTGWADFSQSKISSSSGQVSSVPFTGGFVGIIPYETYTEFDDGPEPLVFRVKGSLVCDNRSGEVYVCASNPDDFPTVAKIASNILSGRSPEEHAQSQSIALISDTNTAQYESMIKQALEDIRDGRYYQINLLRYFQAAHVSNVNMAELINNRGGPFSCWFRHQRTEIISFSPEQFVEIRANGNQKFVSTSPIKGTSPRYSDPIADQISADELQRSSKNLAELHMIIDLMRNDLNKICLPGTTTVTERNKLLTFANVHHLAGTIKGRLKEGITVDEFFKALCPGGSITGAPKIEVIRAIREFEQRPRGYFMGHAFMQDTSGLFNSSVLIRTVCRSVRNKYEFSAGSGIVIHSDPTSERLEIDAKCNVLRPQEHS